MAKSKPVDIDIVIARIDKAMEKYGTSADPADTKIIRAVLAGPPTPQLPQRSRSLKTPLTIETLGDPEANRLFQDYVARYIQVSGEKPSRKVLNILKCIAEIDGLMKQQMRCFVASREEHDRFSFDILDKINKEKP